MALKTFRFMMVMLSLFLLLETLVPLFGMILYWTCLGFNFDWTNGGWQL